MNTDTKNIPLMSLLLTSMFFFIWSFKETIFAASDEELLKDYEKMESVMHVRSGWMYDDIFRKLGWWFIQGLVLLNDWIENSVTKIITLNNFYSSPQVAGLINIVKPLVFGLFVIAIFILGFQFMMNKIEKREEVLLNILMAVSVVVVIPILMTSLGKVLDVGMDQMKNHNPSLAGAVLKSNIVDLKYYAEKDFKVAGSANYGGNSATPPRPIDPNDAKTGTSDYKYGNKLNNHKVSINVNETLDLKTKEKEGGYKDWGDNTVSGKAQELLSNKMVPTGNGVNKKVVALRDNQIKFTDVGRETYYRYHVSFWIIIFTLIITAVALAITVIKIGRAIFDLAFHQIFGMFVAVTDLTGGQRTKKILVEIANTFGILFIMVFILKLFVLYANWVGGLTSSIGSVGVILLLIAGAWAVIDAPDVVQRLMGLDAGLRSGYGALMGAYAGASLAGKGSGLVKGIAGGAMAKGAGAAGMLKGGIDGVRGSKSRGNHSNIPPNGGDGGNQPNIPPNSGDGVSQSKKISTNDSLEGLSEQLKNVQYATGGLVTGSMLANRMGYAHDRGRSTGQFIGRGIRTAGRGVSRVSSLVGKAPLVNSLGRGIVNTGMKMHNIKQSALGSIGRGIQQVSDPIGESVTHSGMKMNNLKQSAFGSIGGGIQQVTNRIGESVAHSGMKMNNLKQSAFGSIGDGIQQVSSRIGSGVANTGTRMHNLKQSRLGSIGRGIIQTKKIGQEKIMQAGVKTHHLQHNVLNKSSEMFNSTKQNTRKLIRSVNDTINKNMRGDE